MILEKVEPVKKIKQDLSKASVRGVGIRKNIAQPHTDKDGTILSSDGRINQGVNASMGESLEESMSYELASKELANYKTPVTKLQRLRELYLYEDLEPDMFAVFAIRIIRDL